MDSKRVKERKREREKEKRNCEKKERGNERDREIVESFRLAFLLGNFNRKALGCHGKVKKES
jgi:hypothetical protein